MQTLTPRNLETFRSGQSRYALITAPNGGVISDPVITFLKRDKIWLSAADGDLVLWVLGALQNSGHDVSVREADIAAIQAQGPRSPDIMESVVGSGIRDLGWYQNGLFGIDGKQVIVTRTGWTSELGFEVYPFSGDGPAIWDRIMAAGASHGIKVGHTSTARRIEGGILAMIADMDMNTSALEVAPPKLVDLDQKSDFIGKAALLAERTKGVRRKVVGLRIDGSAFPHPNEERWLLKCSNAVVGLVTSAVYSPRLCINIAIALIETEHASENGAVEVVTEFGVRTGQQTAAPFYDPKKAIPRGLETWDTLRRQLA